MKKNIKRPPQTYINKVKERAVEYESSTYTFRFNRKLMERFKTICDENDVTMTDVLKEFIEDFASQK